MTAVLVLMFAMLLPLAAMAAILTWVRRLRARSGRRSPLADKLYHGPGEQLRLQIDGHETEIQGAILLLFCIGPIVLAGWGLTRADWSWRTALSMVLPMLVGSFVAAFAIRKLLRHERALQPLREGMAAERMTAQQLTPLIAEGCMLFHDIPADSNGRKFNLDHVVIGPNAVFAVETKSRKKPAGKGKELSQVTYDGNALRFPDHLARDSLEQARAQARWLKEYLRGAAGELVPVIPVLALPGWYVNLTKDGARADVAVINPKMHGVFTDRRHGPPITESLRNRIAHALVQRYPNLPAD